jgi:hypothetical protein
MSKMSKIFDIVICHGPKDNSMLKKNLQHTRKNIVGFRNIYIITYDARLVNMIPGCKVVYEGIFPFKMDDVKQFIKSTTGRHGWYLQQLLKLYAHSVLPELSDYYLVIDCDTLFLKPTTFFTNNNNNKIIPLYNVGFEYHSPYFNHIYKLDKNIKKQMKESGICHHMMFYRPILKELFERVVRGHSISNDSISNDFWKIFLKSVNPDLYNGSGASEYELYFNYVLQYHRNEIHIRKLKWNNINEGIIGNINNYNDNVYVSYHWYQRSNSSIGSNIGSNRRFGLLMI